jgi:hypothetical protein
VCLSVVGDYFRPRVLSARVRGKRLGFQTSNFGSVVFEREISCVGAVLCRHDRQRAGNSFIVAHHLKQVREKSLAF